MSRYVDLDESVTAQFYDQECEEWTMQTVTIADVLDSVCDDYTVLPTIEPRMRGKWVNRRMSGKTCSICGYDYDCKGTDSENFCPNCGADMRGEQNGQ